MRVLSWYRMFYIKTSTAKDMRRSFNCHKMFKCSILGVLPEITSTLVLPPPKWIRKQP